MLFGIPEIQEYEKTCTDPYVLAIIKKLWESRSTCAKQQEYIARLEDDISYCNPILQDMKFILKEVQC
jgi:hypothetical protein